MDLGLKGRRALVMGASRGLGKAIALQLASEGADLMLVARSKGKLEALAKQIGADHGVQADSMTLELGNDASLQELLGWVASVDRLDSVLVNTGGPAPSIAPGINEDVWAQEYRKMVLPAIQIMDACVARMRDQKFGRMLAITSSGMVQPIPILAVSNTLRASVAAYAKTLGDQVIADNISINIIMPGRIATERVDELDYATAEKQSKSVSDIQDSVKATIPAGRYGTPEEFAKVATFFLSEHTGYATGNLLRVDGGAIRGIWA